MSYLNGRWGIAKVKDTDDCEVFELRHEKSAFVGRNGYMWSTEYLNEEQLRDALVAGGATPSDVERVFAEARANFWNRSRKWPQYPRARSLNAGLAVHVWR